MRLAVVRSLLPENFPSPVKFEETLWQNRGARGERGGKKTRAQKERRRATAAGERTPLVNYPVTPNFGSQRSSGSRDPIPTAEELPSASSVAEHPLPEFRDFPTEASAQEAERDSDLVEIETPETEAESASRRRQFSGPVESVLRPRFATSAESAPGSAAVPLSATRILIVTDFHGVLDTPEFLKYYGSRRQETSGEVPLVNRQAVHRLLQSDRIQLAVLSYIGSKSVKLRKNATSAIRHLNAYLRDKGCGKRVGISICDQPSEKASIVSRVRAAAFVDDKLKTCQEAAAASPNTWVYFEAERRSRDKSVSHVRLFSEFVDHILGSRLVPVEDNPPWLSQLPIFLD